jgi:hypothetical protein
MLLDTAHHPQQPRPDRSLPDPLTNLQRWTAAACLIAQARLPAARSRSLASHLALRPSPVSAEDALAEPATSPTFLTALLARTDQHRNPCSLAPVDSLGRRPRWTRPLPLCMRTPLRPFQAIVWTDAYVSVSMVPCRVCIPGVLPHSPRSSRLAVVGRLCTPVWCRPPVMPARGVSSQYPSRGVAGA